MCIRVKQTGTQARTVYKTPCMQSKLTLLLYAYTNMIQELEYDVHVQRAVCMCVRNMGIQYQIGAQFREYQPSSSHNRRNRCNATVQLHF